jgi:hypothetical protein
MKRLVALLMRRPILCAWAYYLLAFGVYWAQSAHSDPSGFSLWLTALAGLPLAVLAFRRQGVLAVYLMLPIPVVGLYLLLMLGCWYHGECL